MAEMICKFDTITKKVIVTIDGKAVDNVNYFSAGKCYYCDPVDEDQFSATISTSEEDETSGIRTYTSMSASLTGEIESRPATKEEIEKATASQLSAAKSLSKMLSKLIQRS